VAIELALENRHRSVTLASFTCSGSEVTEGLFLDMDPREGASEIPGGKVRAQLDQLSELICRGARSQHATYTLPVYVHGSTQVSMQSVAKAWCPPPSRKRAIDLVLLSIGGNDVGFGALAAYSLTESITDLAPIAGLAGLAGHSSRFSPQVSRIYLDVLDERMQALKQALQDGFGVSPARVVQSSYEPIHHDETGRCAERSRPWAWTCIPASGSAGSAWRRPRISCRGCSAGSNASPGGAAPAAPPASPPAPAPAFVW
jgi:hypothetical protein